MALEIERKFLVAGDGWRDAVRSQSRLRQGYLALTDRAEIRVRLVAASDGQTSARLTVKSAEAGLLRQEFEYEIPADDAVALLDRCIGRIIEKTRYRLAFGDRVWEVDVFDGALAGLVTAEVELGSNDEAPELPDWLGRELTGDKRYSNAAMAGNGWPPTG